MNTTLNIQKEIESLRIELLNHDVYTSINNLNDLRVFLEYHVFAVWDFMSLLKGLQKELTCITTPWVPTGNPSTRRFINEIVLDEETDRDKEGNPVSHFELYIKAMNECRANTTEIGNLIYLLNQGDDLKTSISKLDIAESIKEFVLFTFSVIDTNEPHKIAAAFTFGREDLIPEMFSELVTDLNKKFSGELDQLVYYLDRHIELDGDVHGPLAMQMIEELCGEDDTKWEDCIRISKEALKKRIDLWDSILKEIKNRKLLLVQ